MIQSRLIENEDDKRYRCCPLWETRNKIVWIRGTSTKDVDILFIGEAPGKDEDLYGRPFVGRAGQILNKWIEESKLSNYAIINIVKCRPPNNRKPLKSEIRACLPHFINQIKELNPKLIVALGATAISVLIDRSEVLSNVGKVFKSRFGDVMVFPHPSFVLRGADIYIPIKELKNIAKRLKGDNLLKGDQNGSIR